MKDFSGSHCAWATRIPSNPVSHWYVPHRSHGTLLLHFPLVIVFHLYFLAFCSADFTECMILPGDFYCFHTWASGRLRFLVRALSRQGLRPSACPIRAERCCGTLVGGSVLPRKPSGTSIWSRDSNCSCNHLGDCKRGLFYTGFREIHVSFAGKSIVLPWKG